MAWTCPHCSKVLKTVHSIGGHVRRCGITPAELFWSRVNKDASNGCWEWVGHRQTHGHGVVTRSLRNGRRERIQTLAHRYAWELEASKIPEGMFLLHKCGNPPCVNPDHLYVGGYKENGRDMVEHGRSTRGERSRTAKLTEVQVMRIRHAHAKGVGDKELASKYGVKPHAIYQIWRGANWKHLPLVPTSTRSKT